MGYRPEEFDAAFIKAAAKYPSVRRSVAEQVLGHLESAKLSNQKKPMAERRPFGLLIRLALNEASVMQKGQRTAYASIIGFIYGRHGNYIAERNRKNPHNRPVHSAFPSTAPAPEVGLNAKGQKEWKF